MYTTLHRAYKRAKEISIEKKVLNKSNLKDLNNFAHLGNFQKIKNF